MLSITSIPGLRVGHAQDTEAMTGCTVVLCEAGAVCGVDQRGGAPGTRETDALHPLNLVQQAHAVVLAGGSAFGLDSASGVMRYLEERGVGMDTPNARVPIVSAAILYDLGVSRADIRPDAAMGYQACLNASSEPPAEGNVGAGMGASVGKILGMGQAMKAGIGCAALEICEGLYVGALAAVNAIGDIIDPETGRIVAGARALPGQEGGPQAPFADTLQVLRKFAAASLSEFAQRGERQQSGQDKNGADFNPPPAGSNTVIGVVATNAKLNKVEANKVAQMAHDGLARAIRPAHTMVDGDTIFALATGELPADVNTIGAFAAEAFAQAILRAVRLAAPTDNLPAASSFPSQNPI